MRIAHPPRVVLSRVASVRIHIPHVTIHLVSEQEKLSAVPVGCGLQPASGTGRRQVRFGRVACESEITMQTFAMNRK